MTNTTTAPPGVTLKLSEATVQALRDTWRAAGGVVYSAPSGQVASMSERRLHAFLAEYLAAADESLVDRAVPVVTAIGRRCDAAELALRQLVNAVCPGLDGEDLLGGATKALAAMASASPAGYFAIDDAPAADGSPRYLHIGAEHKNDEDVFPMYRTASLLTELPPAGDVDSDAVQTTKAVAKRVYAKKAASK